MSNHKYRYIPKNICIQFSLQLTAVNYLQWFSNFIDNQYNVIQTGGPHQILLQILNQYFSHLKKCWPARVATYYRITCTAKAFNAAFETLVFIETHFFQHFSHAYLCMCRMPECIFKILMVNKYLDSFLSSHKRINAVKTKKATTMQINK